MFCLFLNIPKGEWKYCKKVSNYELDLLVWVIGRQIVPRQFTSFSKAEGTYLRNFWWGFTKSKNNTYFGKFIFLNKNLVTIFQQFPLFFSFFSETKY